MTEESMKMRLVGQDEFDEESLSDDGDHEDVELHKLRVTRKGFNTMSGFTQVVVYVMLWCITMGVSMLAFHIVARADPNRQMVIFVGLSAAWIALSNIFAFASFVIDKYRSFNSQPRMSEALALTHFMLGGVVGGWLALCATCYKPPGIKEGKMSGFICRAMLCSCMGLGLVIFLLLRVLIPNTQLLADAISSP